MRYSMKSTITFQHSVLALCISLSLSTHSIASGIYFPDLPSNGQTVNNLPGYIVDFLPSTAFTEYQKVTPIMNYTPILIGGSALNYIPVYGDNITIEKDSSQAIGKKLYPLAVENKFDANHSYGAIFGNNLTLISRGDYIDGLYTGSVARWLSTTGTNQTGDGDSYVTDYNPSFLIIGDGLKISTTGKRSVGIHADWAKYLKTTSNLASSRILIGDDATIETAGSEYSYGIYAQNTGSNKPYPLSSTINITLGDGSKIITRGKGLSNHGVYASVDGPYDHSSIKLGKNTHIETFGTSSYGASGATISIGENSNIITHGDNAHGLFGGNINYGAESSVITEGVGAHAVVSQYRQMNEYAIRLMGNNKLTTLNPYASHGIQSLQNGLVVIENGISINTAGNHQSNSYAMYTTTNWDDGSDSVATIDGSAGGKYLINGDIMSEGGFYRFSSYPTEPITDTTNIPAKYSLVDLKMEDGSVWNGAAYLGTLQQEFFYNEDYLNGTWDTFYLPIEGRIQINMINSTWNMTDSSTVSSLILNGGTINMQHNDENYRTLKIRENYVGGNGLLVMNAQLGDDNSPTDKLIVEGNTSGITRVAINNTGGSGDNTQKGIEIISVLGRSDGIFKQEGRITGGAFDYFLIRGNAATSTESKNWYLVNYMPLEPTPETAPESTPESLPEPKSGPEPTHRPVLSIRPEVGSYTTNHMVGNTLFITRLHDRLGETQYTDAITGEHKVTSMWIRHIGGHTRFHDDSGSLKTQTNRYVVQLGGDIAQWSSDGHDRLHLGLMAGYGNAKSNTRSGLTQYESNGSVNGYSLGAYATWYDNDDDKSGSYLDSWILYNWFKNNVSADNRKVHSYKSNGVSASLEGGYSFKLSENVRDSFWLQPKAQLVWMDVQSDNQSLEDGTQLRFTGNGNIMTRLGARAYIQGHNSIDDDKNRKFQPFIELNWIYNTKKFGVSMDGWKNEQRGSKNVGEVKIGIEGKIDNNFNIWGNIGQQLGDEGYSDTSAVLGIKYLF